VLDPVGSWNEGMSAGFAAGAMVALAGFSCALCASAGATNKKRLGFNCTAAMPNRRHETAAMIKRDDRCTEFLPSDI